MSPKIVDKTQKRTEIVQAALKVFARDGTKRARMADVAIEAGVGKGTLYEYFSSRDELVTGAFLMVMGEMEARIGIEEARLTDPAEKLSARLRITFDVFFEYADEFCEIFLDFWSEGYRHSTSLEHRGIDLGKMYNEYRHKVVSSITAGQQLGMFRKTVNPTTVASMYIAAVDGLILQYIVDRNAFDKSTIVHEMEDLILNGLRDTDQTED